MRGNSKVFKLNLSFKLIGVETRLGDFTILQVDKYTHARLKNYCIIFKNYNPKKARRINSDDYLYYGNDFKNLMEPIDFYELIPLIQRGGVTNEPAHATSS